MKQVDSKLSTSAIHSLDNYHTPTKNISADREKILSDSKKLAFSKKFYWIKL